MMRLLGDRFIKKKREGSSLVSVVIGVLFLAAIGVIVLTAANQYMISVNVDHNSSNNFYDAEAILEEVKTGLLEYAGDASEEAYKYMLKNYAKDKNSKREVFARKYLSLLATKLRSSGDGSFELTDDKLGKKQSGDIQRLKVLVKESDAVTAKTDEPTKFPFIIRKDSATGEYSLVILNMLIDYTNEVDYRTSIQTDICLTVPDYSLEGNSTFDEMKDYISISDDTLQIKSNIKDNLNAKSKFLGNVYTGNTKQGILLEKDCGADFKSSIIISRGDLELHNGADATLSGETGNGDLYLQNIRLTGDPESELETNLTLKDENAYIANDLNIENNKSTVTLGGKYYGYSYNETNSADPSASPVPEKSDYSSAILINGKDTTLKTDGLKSLVLAGRAFVSRETEDKKNPVSDIMMGESISVKSNQLAYLVPDEFITAKEGNSDDYQNPVFKKDESKVSIDVEGLKKKFGSYLANSDEPYEANYNNTIGYVFYYLKFKDAQAANKYFEDYYNGEETDEDGDVISHKNELQEKGKVYIRNKDLGLSFAPELYLLAGNVMNNYDSTSGSGLQAANYFGANQEANQILLDEGKRMGQNYVGYMCGLTPAKNTTGAMRLPSVDADGNPVVTKPMVASTILDFDNTEFKEKVPDALLVKGPDKTGVEDGTIYVSKEDYTVSDPMTGLLIVDGDVTVRRDFTGLILATGKVTVDSGNLNLKSDMILVGKLFDYIRTDEDLVHLFRELNGTAKSHPSNLAECVSYQNWSKNDY